MNGWIPLAPAPALTAAANRDPAGNITIGSVPTAGEFEVKFRIEVPSGAASSVALVNGSYPVDPAGPDEQKPEASLYVVAAGTTAEFPVGDVGFDLLAGPFHVCRVSTAGADVSGVRVRAFYRRKR